MGNAMLVCIVQFLLEDEVHQRQEDEFARAEGRVAFSAIAIVTLALGIGGVTAMASAFDTILIRSEILLHPR